MAKLLTINTQVLLPAGATGGRVRVDYPEPYRVAAQMAGGRLSGSMTLVSGGPWATFDAALRVYGGEVGDPVPPLVTVTITPTGPGVQAVPIIYQGHPRDTGGGAWNLSSLGAVGPVLATPEMLASLAEVDPKLALIDDKLTEVDQALADNAQLQQDVTSTMEQAVTGVSTAVGPNGGVILLFDRPVPTLAPSNLHITAETNTYVDLAWTRNSADETGFGVQISLDGLAWTDLTVGIAAGATTYRHTFTSATEKQWHYRVTALRNLVRSDYTNTVQHVPLYPLGMYGWYQFAEGSGAQVLDSSGSGRHGTLSGTVGRLAGAGLQFTRQGSVNLGNIGSADPANGLYILMAVRQGLNVSGDGAFQALIGKWSADTNTGSEYALFAQSNVSNTGPLQLFARNGTNTAGGSANGTTNFTDGSVQDNTWHWVELQFSAAGRLIGRDAIDTMNAANAPYIPQRAAGGVELPLEISRGNGLRGEVATVVIYQRALTTAERQRVRQSERARLAALSTPIVMPNV